MTKEYPGSEQARQRIQDHISTATGHQEMPASCACGRNPMVVSVGYNLVRVACTCGFQGLNKPTINEAVDDWNRSTQDRKIEALR